MAFNWTAYRCDFVLLFLTRILRMISYGSLSVVFFENLFNKHISEVEATWMQTAIVSGDIVISLFLTTRADRIGRLNTLILGAILKLITGLVYAESSNLIILLITGIFGVISVTGGEIGPFMPIEQSALSQLIEKSTDDHSEVQKNIAKVFGYYNLVGYLAQASGAVFAGFFISFFTSSNIGSGEEAITYIIRLYAFLGGLMGLSYFLMNKEPIEPNHVVDKKIVNCSGIAPQNFKTVITLSALFASDAFAGAFIVQSYLSYYYKVKYDRLFEQIGIYLFICNIVSGISGILSSKLVHCIGAMATMIYTHLPSNVFLICIALTNNVNLSLFFLFARFCISQMDVPARQTFVTMIVSPAERSAANGITNIARSVGLAFGLGFNGYFMQMDKNSTYFSAPFLIAGVVKIVYDITIGCCFLWNKSKSQHSQVGSLQLVETGVSDKEDIKDGQEEIKE